MKKNIANRRTYLNFLGVIVLILGLCSAVFIYRTAGNDLNGTLGYEEGDGSVYPVMPEDSKSYQRSLELYGGKANVLADEIRRWLIGLWHGKSLAFTTAFITIFVSLAIFCAANVSLPPLDTYTYSKDKRDGTG